MRITQVIQGRHARIGYCIIGRRGKESRKESTGSVRVRDSTYRVL